jgi:hypothetical protein
MAMAAIDWDAAITALNGSGIPCSGGFTEQIPTRQ